MASRIRISRRCSGTERPDAKAPPLVFFDPGTELELVGREGNFFRVSAPGGRSFYVPRDRAAILESEPPLGPVAQPGGTYQRLSATEPEWMGCSRALLGLVLLGAGFLAYGFFFFGLAALCEEGATLYGPALVALMAFLIPAAGLILMGWRTVLLTAPVGVVMVFFAFLFLAGGSGC